MEDRILKMAYEEAVCDLILELTISEKEAKNRLNKILEQYPNYLESYYKQFYAIRYHMEN